MKLRKVVAVLTAVLMLCCIIPFSAAAEGNSATIDFTDKANRVSYSTEQQVWAQNGITVTNDKGASTSNVGDYGGEGYPVRFYKSSTVTVAYGGMTQIVFNCDDYKSTYATDLAASITDGTVTVDGTVVTVVLDAPVDALVIESLAAQVRVDSITVYGEGGGETPDTPDEPDTPVEPDEPEEPEDPDMPGVSGETAVLDFSTLDNRVSCSTSQQVWQQNGITFTNDKGASTSNVNEKYFNPVRCYKSSTVTIAYPGMTKIVIDSVTYADNDYAIGWTNSFTADATATVVDGDVTIVLAEPADVFVWEQLTSQSRAYTITVYTGDAGEGGDTPVEPDQPSDDPEPDTELSIADAIALGLSQEHNVFTEGKYYVEGEIVEVYNTQYGNMRIKDAEGNILTIYGTWNYDGTVRYDALDKQPAAGDYVYLYGIIGQYNGTAQMKNGWIVDCIYDGNDGPGEGGDTPVDPDPDVPDDDDDIDTTVPYLLGMVQENVSTEDVYFLAGGMAQTYYFATTTDPEAAILVYLEKTVGGYYLYTYDECDYKLYINMVVSDTHVNGVYEYTASTVYNYDWDLWTLVTEINDGIYAFGTRNDRNYTTMGPVNVDYNGFHADLYYFEEESDCYHEYEITETAPTCGADGEILYECVVCGYSEIEVVPATGEHVYDDDYDADCNVCGAVREVSEPPVYVGVIGATTNSAAAGETVDITIQIDNNPGIVSAKVKVHFDNTALKLVGYAAGEFSAGGYSWGDADAANEKGYFIVNWCDATQPDSMAQMLVTLTFEVLEGTEEGLYDIVLEFNCDEDIFNANDETVWFEAVDGGVAVVNTVPGDANGDGKVNNRDLGLLQRYLNGWGVEVDESAADISGDGKVNNRDLGLLQKMLNA